MSGSLRQDDEVEKSGKKWSPVVILTDLGIH
jgi:hypothetical protein